MTPMVSRSRIMTLVRFSSASIAYTPTCGAEAPGHSPTAAVSHSTTAAKASKVSDELEDTHAGH